ncbi:MAG: DUF948 domain-containing protein [Calditrichaeota bacterium]|nr:MAG: DUF948 domain-containing protein [Calditrichota bacterium]
MVEKASVVVIAIALVVLIGILIPTLIQIRRTARRFESMADILGQYLPGILNNVDAITGQLAGILADFREQMGLLKEAGQGVKQLVDDVVVTEKRIRQDIERPLADAVGNVQAIARSVRVFFDVLLGRRAKS